MKVENGHAGREEASPSEGWQRALSPAVLTQRRELYQGFGDTLAVAFELAFTPVVLGLMGYGLDRWIGTLPILTIVFVLMAIVGLSARMWYGYCARMKVHEANGPWARCVPPAAPPSGALIAPGAVDPEASRVFSDYSGAGDQKGTDRDA